MAIVDQLEIPGIPKVIDARQHAFLDYGVAATFFMMGARMLPRHKPAATLAFINGAMVLGMSLLTDYPGGVWRRISFPMHGALDIVQAAAAGLGPAIMGFAGDEEANAFYGQAISEIGVIAATDWRGAN